MQSFKLYLLIFIAAISSEVASQNKQHLIQGIVIDDSTKAPIPYVSIGVLNGSSSSTVSNENGKFELRLDALPKKVEFRHIAYEAKEISITNEDSVSISLKPAVLILNSVVIDSSLPYKFVNNAHKKATDKKRETIYGDAFYRQITINGNKPVEILEAFYELEITNQGIQKREMRQGRYAIKKDGVMRFTNFSYLTSIKAYYEEVKGIILPTVANPEAFFEMNIEGYFNEDEQEFVKISFIPKENMSKPALEGTLVLNTDTYDILNIKGKIISPPVQLIAFNNDQYDSRNQVYSFEINFTNNKDTSIPKLVNINIGMEFDLYRTNSFVEKVKVNGILLVYNSQKDKKRGLNKIKHKQNDIEKIHASDYNPDFWKNNPVIRRTPLEESLIESFNSENAFGSLVE